MESPNISHLTATDVAQLDPYAFLAVLGKRVIHPGGRRFSEELFRRAGFQPDQVLTWRSDVIRTEETIVTRLSRKRGGLIALAIGALVGAWLGSFAFGRMLVLRFEEASNKVGPTLAQLIAQFMREATAVPV